MKSLYLWIWNFLGVGGTKWKNHGNSRGWGIKLEKNPPWGGMDIFWNHTFWKNSAFKQRNSFEGLA